MATMSRKWLMEQDLSKLDVTKLHPLSPEVISRQATINIGTIGHMVNQQSTVRFKNELERNITIKLGYTNAKKYINVKMSVVLNFKLQSIWLLWKSCKISTRNCSKNDFQKCLQNCFKFTS